MLTPIFRQVRKSDSCATFTLVTQFTLAFSWSSYLACLLVHMHRRLPTQLFTSTTSIISANVQHGRDTIHNPQTLLAKDWNTKWFQRTIQFFPLKKYTYWKIKQKVPFPKLEVKRLNCGPTSSSQAFNSQLSLTSINQHSFVSCPEVNPQGPGPSFHRHKFDFRSWETWLNQLKD